jgi:hypothetical protein
VAKKTDTALAPEPIGAINGFDGSPIIIWECPGCLSVVTSLTGHYEKRPECG